MQSFKFHQFVVLERGHCNTAIIDFLKGDVFQVENRYIAKFEKNEYEEITEFIESLVKAELIIAVEENTWIPRLSFKKDEKLDKGSTRSLILEIEEGVDWGKISTLFSGIPIKEIRYFGTAYPESIFPGVPIIKQEKDFSNCITRATISGQFAAGVDENVYRFSMVYNNCWGGKIALTRDAKIRPCIYSTIEIGDINEALSGGQVIETARDYWALTLDKVDKCKECELRYICPDCREIAARESGNLSATNPNCKYDPYTGVWQSI